MKFITVGDQKTDSQCDINKKRPQYWKYGDVPVDKKGWSTDSNYRPTPFDMCSLKTKELSKIINGWWTGLEWRGLRLKESNPVIAWKINEEFY